MRTKGHDAPQVWADKVAWCRAHLPDVPVIVTDDKACVHGHVLVDDWMAMSSAGSVNGLLGWRLCRRSLERSNGAGAAPIRDDGRNREAVAAALRRCRAHVDIK